MSGWVRSAACASSNCVEVRWQQACLSGTDNVQVGFTKAAASGASNCVEVGHGVDRVLVRDSKDPDGPVLSFTPDEWAAFLTGCRRREFDRG